MKVMIDTNIFISAALFPNGRAAAAFQKALIFPWEPVACDYVIEELHRKFQEKFPTKIADLNIFLSSALSVIEVVTTPKTIHSKEPLVRDKKDQPILRAAISAKVDYLLTGDKDFLEANLDNPHIISVANFLLL
ncbi:putative toxin-antitoxin system toxin component, PIN family [Anaerovibrio lipolyticus]|uniref:putative toxin-antitoxin system toxin component, PIN family n=1 Tax=Anaerovibrio lipolyticus TaxID=82374 RepID=UPI0023F04174|nr:putative toxin-antitoxin system toxin component, PIN family [Anaerovibrio lipolyticus]